MTDHLKEARVDDQATKTPDRSRATEPAGGFDLGSWPASGSGGSGSPNAIKGTRGNNQDLESPSPK